MELPCCSLTLYLLVPTPSELGLPWLQLYLPAPFILSINMYHSHCSGSILFALFQILLLMWFSFTAQISHTQNLISTSHIFWAYIFDPLDWLSTDNQIRCGCREGLCYLTCGCLWTSIQWMLWVGQALGQITPALLYVGIAREYTWCLPWNLQNAQPVCKENRETQSKPDMVIGEG